MISLTHYASMTDTKWKNKISKFLAAQTISLLGSSLVQYAIIWFITLKTSSGMMMAIATICGYMPQMSISLFAGVWIDRYNRKFITMAADALIAFATLIIALLLYFGFTQIWLLFIVLIVRSIGTGIQTPTVNALIPQIVPQQHLLKINGINSSLNALTMFLSPVLSGLILSLTSIETTFFVDVVTAIIGISLTATIAIPPLKQEQNKSVSQSIFTEIKNGFAYLANHQLIRRQLLFIVVVMILISPSAFLTPLLVSRSFGAEVWRLSVSEMTFSLGAIAGGILIAWLGGCKNRVNTIVISTVAYGCLMMAIGAAPNFILYLIFNGLIGITMPCFNAPVNVLIQENSEAAMHGRLFSIMQVANACALPIGTLVFGPLADVISVNTLMICCGLAVIGVALYHSKH